MSRWILAVLFCFSSFAFANIQILSVNGASNVSMDSDSNVDGTPVIYGGVAGDVSNCSDDEDGVNLCNNCEELTNNWEICNDRRIYDGLTVTITFRSLSPMALGRAFLRDANGTALNLNATPILPAGAIHTIEVLWSDICGAIEEGADTCEGMSDSAYLKLSIENGEDSVDATGVTFVVATPDEASNTNKATIDLCEDSIGTDSQGGVCSFEANSRSGLTYIESLAANGSFPSEDNILIDRIRVFISHKSFYDLSGPGRTTGVLSPEDLKVTLRPDGRVEAESLIAGLIVGQKYFFKLGVVDLAGNLSRVTSDNAITEACGSLATPAADCPFSTIVTTDVQ